MGLAIQANAFLAAVDIDPSVFPHVDQRAVSLAEAAIALSNREGGV